MGFSRPLYNKDITKAPGEGLYGTMLLASFPQKIRTKSNVPGNRKVDIGPPVRLNSKSTQNMSKENAYLFSGTLVSTITPSCWFQAILVPPGML